MATFAVSKGITRFEDQANHSNGYMVRIRRKGKQTNEFFSDSVHGGKRKARAVAIERYDQLEKELGPANASATRGLITDRNTTGVVGVHIAHSVDTRWTGNDYYSYCASWSNESGKRQKISFSWAVYGKEKAFGLAILARKKMLVNRATVLSMYEKLGSKVALPKQSSTKSTAKSSAKSAPSKKSSKPVKKKLSAKKNPAKKKR